MVTVNGNMHFHGLLHPTAPQGAFMAALYGQGLPRSGMQAAVREYAGSMGSVRCLLSDLTFPLMSDTEGGAGPSCPACPHRALCLPCLVHRHVHGLPRTLSEHLTGQLGRPCSPTLCLPPPTARPLQCSAAAGLTASSARRCPRARSGWRTSGSTASASGAPP